MSPFEGWWQSQDRLFDPDERKRAREGWDFAFNKTFLQLKPDGQNIFDARPLILRGTMPFDLGHNGAIRYIVGQLNRGLYPDG